MPNDQILRGRQARDTIFKLATEYSPSAELTHSDYHENKDGFQINLCMCFEHPATLKGFGTYLETLAADLSKLPPDIRCNVGFNYDEGPGFAVHDGKLTQLSHDAFMALPSDNPLGYDHSMDME